MAHFAKLESGKVTQVVVVANDDCGGGTFPESEPIGRDYLESCGLSGYWLQTSYHGSFRGCYAGIGFSYDETLDVFVPPTEP